GRAHLAGHAAGHRRRRRGPDRPRAGGRRSLSARPAGLPVASEGGPLRWGDPLREGDLMSDGESTTPGGRSRRSYGLPGPTSPAHDAAPDGGPSDGGQPYGAPSDPGVHGAGQAWYGPAGHGPQTGPLPASGAPAPTSPRRRGLLPLIIGLVLLL